jgi:hypothetical protein
MDRQMECANYSVGQIFYTVVRHDQRDWIDHTDMTEFAINASVLETTRYVLFKLNGGYMPFMIWKFYLDEAIPTSQKSLCALGYSEALWDVLGHLRTYRAPGHTRTSQLIFLENNKVKIL